MLSPFSTARRGAVLALVLSAGVASATITVIAEQGNPSPVPGLGYQRFNAPLDVRDPARFRQESLP